MRRAIWGGFPSFSSAARLPPTDGMRANRETTCDFGIAAAPFDRVDFQFGWVGLQRAVPGGHALAKWLTAIINPAPPGTQCLIWRESGRAKWECAREFEPAHGEWLTWKSSRGGV